jgi:hypothetical protein
MQEKALYLCETSKKEDLIENSSGCRRNRAREKARGARK